MQPALSVSELYYLINILGEIRQKVIKNYKNISERRKVLKDLVNLDLEELKTLENKF